MFKNPKLIKTIVKIGIGFAFSSAIGYAIKLEHRIEDAIDTVYDEPQDENKKND